MAWDYETDAAAATEDIIDAGIPITIDRQGAAGGTASNPTPGAVTTHSGHALFLSYREDKIDGTIVIQGDVMAWTAVLDITPQKGDVLSDGTTRFTVVDPGTLKPGPTEVLHMMQVREIGPVVTP